MKNIIKEVVSYELAVELKKMGYNNDSNYVVFAEYYLDDISVAEELRKKLNIFNSDIHGIIASIEAPLYQQAIDYLLNNKDMSFLYSVEFFGDYSGNIKANGDSLDDFEVEFDDKEDCIKKLMKLIK
jgi:hypothetical protein